MALPLDGYRILDAKEIEEKVEKIRAARKLQKQFNEEYSINRKDNNPKQDPSRR